MRFAARMLLLLLAFAIPCEYSLDFGPPLGNIARLAVIGIVLALTLAVLKEGRIRTPGALHLLVLALFLWFCVSCFWSIDRPESLHHLRTYSQVLIIVWLVWELVDSSDDLRNLLLAYVLGAGLLAVLTIASLVTVTSVEQVRFVAEGQDPNDVARFLDMGFPLAALLMGSKLRWPGKLLAAAYFPIGMFGVLLTASRSGLLAALVALAVCAGLFFYTYRRGFILGLYALPAVLACVWIVVPHQTLARLATIPAELGRGDFNQRADIWLAGWQAFSRAPVLGNGVGSFVAAAAEAPLDTAHNTALALLVEGGIVALLVAAAIVAFCVRHVMELRAPLRIALGGCMLTLLVSSFVSTLQENRATWLLAGMIAVAARLAAADRTSTIEALPSRVSSRHGSAVPDSAVQESF